MGLLMLFLLIVIIKFTMAYPFHLKTHEILVGSETVNVPISCLNESATPGFVWTFRLNRKVTIRFSRPSIRYRDLGPLSAAPGLLIIRNGGREPINIRSNGIVIGTPLVVKLMDYHYILEEGKMELLSGILKRNGFTME